MTLRRYSAVIFLVAASFLIIIFSCKTTRTLAQSDEPLISMATSGCFGRCPIYKISIYPDHRLVYEGIRFNQQTGKFCYVLSKSEFTDLENSLTNANLPGMNDSYPTDAKQVPSDLPSRVIKYARKSVTKTITDHNDQGPQMLIFIEKKLNDLVKTGKLQSCDK